METVTRQGEPTKAELERLLMGNWLTAKAAARELDRTPQMVWKMSKQGRLDTLATPGGVLYSKADVARVLRERESAR
jgi:hypothetical protein